MSQLANGWQTDLPTEDGDWMWVYIWSCECCIHKIGTAWVNSDWHIQEKDGFHYTDINGVNRVMYFQGESPVFRDKIDVTGWKKFESPFRQEYLG